MHLLITIVYEETRRKENPKTDSDDVVLVTSRSVGMVPIDAEKPESAIKGLTDFIKKSEPKRRRGWDLRMTVLSYTAVPTTTDHQIPVWRQQLN